MSTNVTYPVAVSHLVVEVTEFLSSLSPKNAYPAGYSKRSSVAVPSLARSRSGPAVLTASNEVPKPPFSTSPNAPTVFCRRFRKVITQWFPTVLPLQSTFVVHALLVTATAAGGTSAYRVTVSNGARPTRNFLDIVAAPDRIN